MIFNLENAAPDKLAFIDDSGHSMTYGELVHFSSSTTHLLPERSLIFIIGDNTTAVAAFFCSCLHNGWVPLMLNKDIDESLLKVYHERYKPNAVFSSVSMEGSQEAILELGTYRLHRYHDQKIEMYSELSLLLSTSGSTGSPKLVRHSYTNLKFSAASVSRFNNLTSQDVGLALLPIYYTMGLSVITSHLNAEAKVVLTNYPLTDRNFWTILKEQQITVLTGVPYTFEVLFKMRFERVQLPKLRIVSQGGGKLSDNLWTALVSYAQTKNIEFIATYGQTEGTARMAYLESSQAELKRGSIGKAIPGGEFEIWDENGSVISMPDVEGELVYKGGNVTLGYAENQNDLKLGDHRHGVLQTGDIVKRDSEGFFFIVGRKKRFLKIFGLRISLDETELLIKNKFHLDCFATGDDTLLKVYITDETQLAQVKQWLSSTLNLYHQSIEVMYIEQIERTAAGKVKFTQ